MNLSNIIDALPRMKSGNELMDELKVLPAYDPGICNADAPVRCYNEVVTEVANKIK